VSETAATNRIASRIIYLSYVSSIQVTKITVRRKKQKVLLLDSF